MLIRDLIDTTYLASLNYQMTKFLSDKEFIEHSLKDVTSNECQELSKCLEKKYGKILKTSITSEGCRVIVSDDGFTILFPASVWHKFDVQVNDYLVIVERECWACDTSYTFVKIIVNKADIDDPQMLVYCDDDVMKRLNAVIGFLNKNFINNTQAYPDSEYFTIGSYLKNSNTPRPFRMRLGGRFRISF